MTREEAEGRLNIEVDLVPKGASNRPGTKIVPSHITIHNTSNAAKGADARAHARFIKGQGARDAKVSWHFTVDDERCVKHLPTTEKAFHAKSGNGVSIGIEVCEHQGINKAAAIERAALLTAVLMAALGIPEANVVPHQFWTGKDCPRVILREPGGFASFRARAADFLDELGQEGLFTEGAGEAAGAPFGNIVDRLGVDEDEGVMSSGGFESLGSGSLALMVSPAEGIGTAADRLEAAERLLGQLLIQNQLLKDRLKDLREEHLEMP
jgi:hypothetical protein